MAAQTEQSARFRRGWQRLMEVDAEGGERVVESLEDVAPDLGRYVVEFVFGEIYQRPVLDLRQRQLVTISALVGEGGYGSLINQGLARDNFSTPIVVGAGLSIAMALVLDLVLWGVQRLLTPWERAKRAVGSAAALADRLYASTSATSVA